jgi:hypothetical protein
MTARVSGREKSPMMSIWLCSAASSSRAVTVRSIPGCSRATVDGVNALFTRRRSLV